MRLTVWSRQMSDPQKVIRQNTGFVIKENARAMKSLTRAKKYRDEEKTTLAKRYETTAFRQVARAKVAAETVLARHREAT